MAMGRTLGAPVQVDKNTLERDMGHLRQDHENGGKGKEIVKETNNSKLQQPVNMDALSKSQKKRWRRKNNLLQARENTSKPVQEDLEASGSGASEGSTAALVVVEESLILKEVVIKVMVENEHEEVEAEVDTVLVNANVEATTQSNEEKETPNLVGNELSICLASLKGVRHVVPLPLVNPFTNLEEEVVVDTQECDQLNV
ncbi:hypothetical protein FRX31_031838 [Thalictrum thalictroides]|uniref:Uncharacterized protein n=1 Tax=Thalictrum thalictroides TaxID=46969 RepID=A0A7J6V375_THATH|nr:hypothetical protein FRX31_031838 [Thalictrum thalictroides]